MRDRDEEMTWDEADALWAGLSLAEAPEQSDELRLAYERGYADGLEAARDDDDGPAWEPSPDDIRGREEAERLYVADDSIPF